MNNHEDLHKIMQFVFSEIGLVYYRDKEKELCRKIDKAVKRSGATGYREYLMMIQNNPREISREFDNLVSELTIGETHFFRDEKLFMGIKDTVLPAVIEKNKTRKRLWIWSAGCATGEEAYSISILINRYFSHRLQDWDLRITGTDINRDFLHQAMSGVYTDWSFRGTPGEIKQECFCRNENTWHIKPEHQKNVYFQYHNLVSMPVPSILHNLFSFDIIFCRNVMIYFDSKTIGKLIRKFQESLVPDGWLVVGHADHNIRYFGSFKTVMLPGTSFYQNTAGGSEGVLNNGAGIFRMPFPAGLDIAGKTGPADDPKNRSSAFAPEQRVVTDRTGKLKQPGDRQAGVFEQRFSEKKLPDLPALTALINRGRWEDASLLCEALLKATPVDATLYLLSAFILEQKGLANDAVASLRKALYLDRKFVVGHYHLGLLHQNLGDLKKAEKSFDNVINLLQDYDENYNFELADGISAGELKALSEFHIEVLKGDERGGNTT